MAAYGPRRKFHQVQVTINGKTIRGAYERIGDRILVTTIDAQKSVALDGGSEEEVAQRTLGELFRMHGAEGVEAHHDTDAHSIAAEDLNASNDE